MSQYCLGLFNLSLGLGLGPEMQRIGLGLET